MKLVSVEHALIALTKFEIPMGIHVGTETAWPLIVWVGTKSLPAMSRHMRATE